MIADRQRRAIRAVVSGWTSYRRSVQEVGHSVYIKVSHFLDWIFYSVYNIHVRVYGFMNGTGYMGYRN